ncbi:DUF732 domain-containing protein [Mycolicibacterium arenosum]|uniref:DUF732 domain-containing protein n=1 Tax=Mycolicibacterium arenosum TaxID=2952157 RepID=A0ABT1MCD4_9MYCO|nr:DUF732 domain-containing protein [Mycolicibacterium sp. CAU 1645]MCP9275442.1 DUF732 domain-containing protein [Mycolicibacterium sp. CAU 1645]
MIRTTRLASFAVTALAAAGLTTSALIGAGAASAGTVDDLFLEDVANVGIAYDTASGAINDGQLVCQRLDEGADPDDILADYRAASPELTVRQAKGFIVAAATAYCPEYL